MTLMARLILILFGLAYLISPVDIIPDLALPFVGWIDDGLVVWCIYYLIRYGDMPWFLFKRTTKPTTGPKRPQPDTSTGSQSRAKRSSEHNTKDRTKTDSGRRKQSSRPNQKTGTAQPQTSPWDILGIEKNASWMEVQKAYKEKIKQYHPDKLSHLGEEFSSLANEKFLEIQSAYATLKAKYQK